MLIPTIEIELHFSDVSEVRVEVFRSYQEPRIPNPTTEELNRCPARFRCYSCLNIRGKKHFGGETYGQRICKRCFPLVDKGDVRAMINFDSRHGFPVPGRPHSKVSFRKGILRDSKYRRTLREMRRMIWADKGEGFLVPLIPSKR